MKRSLLYLTLLCCFCAPSAQAEIYKWMDDNGQVHYSEQPPEKKRPATEIRIRTYSHQAPLVNPEQRKQQRDNLLRAFAEERGLRNEAKAKEEQEQAKNRRKCLLAKDKIKSYERATSIYNLDEKGERVYLSDAQRDRSMARLKGQVKQWCE